MFSTNKTKPSQLEIDQKMVAFFKKFDNELKIQILRLLSKRSMDLTEIRKNLQTTDKEKLEPLIESLKDYIFSDCEGHFHLNEVGKRTLNGFDYFGLKYPRLNNFLIVLFVTFFYFTVSLLLNISFYYPETFTLPTLFDAFIIRPLLVSFVSTIIGLYLLYLIPVRSLFHQKISDKGEILPRDFNDFIDSTTWKISAIISIILVGIMIFLAIPDFIFLLETAPEYLLILSILIAIIFPLGVLLLYPKLKPRDL